MAEDKKKVTEVTTENIEEIINNGSVVTKEVAEEAAKKIAEKRKEQLTERLIEATQKSEYTRKSIYLSMKKTDKESNIKLNYLKKFSEQDDKLRNGGISLEDYEKECSKLKKEANDLIREVSRWYDDQRDKLYNQYPESRYGWGYNNYML